MIKQNIFIINFNLLYEILDEIKENLSFKIIKFENEDDFIKDTHLDITNSLIISKFKEKLIVKKNITERNLLSFNNFHPPFSLYKLLELINIRLIKLRFNHQSKINIKDYELNLNSKFLFKDDSSLKLMKKRLKLFYI